MRLATRFLAVAVPAAAALMLACGSVGHVTDLLSGEETTQASERTSNTCLALEKAGTDRGITVDLDC